MAEHQASAPSWSTSVSSVVMNAITHSDVGEERVCLVISPALRKAKAGTQDRHPEAGTSEEETLKGTLLTAQLSQAFSACFLYKVQNHLLSNNMEQGRLDLLTSIKSQENHSQTCHKLTR